MSFKTDIQFTTPSVFFVTGFFAKIKQSGKYLLIKVKLQML